MPCITCWIDGGEAIWAARDVVEDRSSGASSQGWLVIFSPMPTTMMPVAGCSMRRPASLRSAQRRSFGHLKRASGRPSERAYSNSEAPTRRENPSQSERGGEAGSEADSQSPPGSETKLLPKRPRPRDWVSAHTACHGGNERQISLVEPAMA